MNPIFVGVSGLPRAGSTLLCQLLAEHPEVDCEGHTSPLCNTLLATRRFISDEKFLLSQLDVQFDRTYANLKTAMRGFLHGWHSGTGKAVVVDKSRGWLQCIEFLLHLEPTAKLLVCIRELGQVYGSVEAQHQRTILLDFIDHIADSDRFTRAEQLFSPDRAIGIPLNAIRAIDELPPAIRDHLYFVRFEELTADPVRTMARVFGWLNLAPHEIDPMNLNVRVHESDSHYRHKFLHRQHQKMVAPKNHEIPPRIQRQIEKDFAWYYEKFYPA